MLKAIPPLPQYAYVAWCLVKHRDNFTFPFYLSYGGGPRSVRGTERDVCPETSVLPCHSPFHSHQSVPRDSVSLRSYQY